MRRLSPHAKLHALRPGQLPWHRTHAPGPPDAGSAAVTFPAHNDAVGLLDRQVDGGLPTSLHDDSPGQEPVEKLGDCRVHGKLHVLAQPRRAFGQATGPAHPSRLAVCGGRLCQLERHDRAGGPLACQVGEPVAGRLLALHEHGGKRLARRCLEGCLVTLVDVDELDEGTERPVDRSQPAGTGSGPGLVECLGEGLGPCRPLVTFSIRRPPRLFAPASGSARACASARSLARPRLAGPAAPARAFGLAR